MTPEQLKISILKCAFSGKLVLSDYSIDDWDNSENDLYKYIWEVTAWDKKFKEVDKKKQKKVISYTYVLAGEFPNLACEDGDILLLSTGNYVGYTTEEKAKGLVSEGEVVTMPWGGGPTIKYFKGRFVTADNRIATSLDTSILMNKYLYYYMLSQVDYLSSIYRGTGLKHPKMSAVLDMRIPLPSINEQEQIVLKIEKILPYVDRYAEAYEKLEQFNAKFPEDMKKSILQYAIQGKLVEQRPEEGTAEELYKVIQEEKQKLIKEGKIKKEKPLAEITEDEIPFDIPDSWKWVRFAEFGSYKKGPFGSALTKSMFVPKGKDTIKVYEQKNAIQKDATLGEYYITKEYYEKCMTGFEVHSGDVIVSCAGTIGETFIMPDNIEKGIINQALMRMQLMPSVYKPYFLLFFDVVLKKNAIKSSKGSAIKNIPPFDELKAYLVPLPPLEEQHRIVAKIEELLPYCDRLVK